MRTLLRLLAAVIAVSLLFASPALAAAPSFTISPTSAQEDAGRLCFPVKMHGTRSPYISSVKVTIAAGTALAGSDYVASSLELLFQPSEFGMTKPACFALIDDTKPEPSETVTGKLTKGLNSRLYVASATGTILDTDPAIKWCKGGITVPAGQPCPVDPPPPAPAWVSFPAGTPWAGLSQTYFARAVKSCSSIYRTAETDRVGISHRGVTAGTVYRLAEPGPATMSLVAAWGWTDAKNIDGQAGAHWTVFEMSAPYPPPAFAPYASVAQACLEGVKPAP